MKIGNLYLSKPKAARYRMVIQASWHWPWSLTWRWIFSIHGHDAGVQLGFHKMRSHQGKGWLIVLNTLFIDFVFQSQPNTDRRLIQLDSKYGKILDKIEEQSRP